MSDFSPQLKQFVTNVLSSGLVWGLKGQEGWAICSSIEFEETEVFPFFDSKQAAGLLCKGEWQHYSPTSLPLEEFIEDWLPGMHEDNVMFGLNWDAELEGPELEPEEVARSFA